MEIHYHGNVFATSSCSRFGGRRHAGGVLPRRRGGASTCCRRLRLPAGRQHDLGAQQVEPERVRQHVLQPRGLPAPARVEEEERVVWQVASTCNHRQHIDGNYAGCLYTQGMPSGRARTRRCCRRRRAGRRRRVAPPCRTRVPSGSRAPRRSSRHLRVRRREPAHPQVRRPTGDDHPRDSGSGAAGAPHPRPRTRCTSSPTEISPPSITKQLSASFPSKRR